MNPEILEKYVFRDTVLPMSPLMDDMHMIRSSLAPLVAECITSNKPPRILVYGVGEHTKVLLAAVPYIAPHIVGFVDRRINGVFMGKPCLLPEQVNAEIADVVVYSSKAFEQQMRSAIGDLPVRHYLIYSNDPDKTCVVASK